MPILATLPWASIITALLSFLLSKASGASTKAALLTGAAVGVGTWFLADPSNPDNLLGVGQSAESEELPEEQPAGSSTTDGLAAGAIAGVASQVVDSTGKVLTSWGPLGTAAVLGGVTGNSKLLLVGALGLLAVLLLK